MAGSGLWSGGQTGAGLRSDLIEIRSILVKIRSDLGSGPWSDVSVRGLPFAGLGTEVVMKSDLGQSQVQIWSDLVIIGVPLLGQVWVKKWFLVF